MLDQLNDEIASFGGEWVKLNRKEHGALEGEIVDVEVREKSFEGQVVLSRKTGQPRKEWVVTLRVPETERDGADDDGIRKVSLNESGQRAFAAAVKAAKAKVEAGGTLKIGVKADPATDREQAEYQARYTPPAKTIDLPDTGGADAGGDDFDF